VGQVNREAFRAWLSGFLEGLAKGDIAPSAIDRILAKIDQVYGAGQPVQVETPTAPPPDPAEMAKLYPSRRKRGAARNSTPVGSEPGEANPRAMESDDEDALVSAVVRLG
jgi:hypothetical protein